MGTGDDTGTVVGTGTLLVSTMSHLDIVGFHNVTWCCVCVSFRFRLFV